MVDTPTDPTNTDEPTTPGGTTPPARSPNPIPGVGQESPPQPVEPTGAVVQPPNPTTPPPPVQGGEPLAASRSEGPAEPPSEIPSDPPAALSDPPTPNIPSEITPDPTPTEPVSSPATLPDPPSVLTPTPTPTDPPETTNLEPLPAKLAESVSADPDTPMTAEQVGPAWMRTDPTVRAAQDAVDPSAGSDVISGAPMGDSPPWPSPADPTTQVMGDEGAPSAGHFPVVIFVILILGIIIAIGVFLFAQGSLPFGG
ncbi:MAG: hypothetical protein A2Z11_01975 [Candidatus Woykebacteria bacterium RBG_16_43_9]|uniref:Uncharacterized protein n=1 Tax=Candidatus Woykebacteria bacterium RBG_16_43_9 TaxID=1802596 RepID=A0A1G1WHY0_9BACT|nr:MAG: hypothetical protein A2Z11_01975 [Candidatus Woykebacteria bacterium RBG_16_43_9]